jgi:hypothetical protein
MCKWGRIQDYSRIRAEAKPTETVLHGEVTKPNEQNLKERLINQESEGKENF